MYTPSVVSHVSFRLLHIVGVTFLDRFQWWKGIQIFFKCLSVKYIFSTTV